MTPEDPDGVAIIAGRPQKRFAKTSVPNFFVLPLHLPSYKHSRDQPVLARQGSQQIAPMALSQDILDIEPTSFLTTIYFELYS
jgi:hypothetical protein